MQKEGNRGGANKGLQSINHEMTARTMGCDDNITAHDIIIAAR